MLLGGGIIFEFDGLPSMEDAREIIFASRGIMGWASGAVGVACVRETWLYILMEMLVMIGTLLMCPWILTSMFIPVFVKTLTPLANCAAEPMQRDQRMPMVFSLALRNLNIVGECDPAVPLKALAREPVQVVEKIVTALLAGWTIWRIDMVRGRDKSSAKMEHLNTNLVAIGKQISSQRTL